MLHLGFCVAYAQGGEAGTEAKAWCWQCYRIDVMTADCGYSEVGYSSCYPMFECGEYFGCSYCLVGSQCYGGGGCCLGTADITLDGSLADAAKNRQRPDRGMRVAHSTTVSRVILADNFDVKQPDPQPGHLRACDGVILERRYSTEHAAMIRYSARRLVL